MILTPQGSIAMIISILSGGHPHPMLAHSIKSILRVTRKISDYYIPGANSTVKPRGGT